MANWKDRVALGVPRAAVIAHDLCMVWAAWTGLHLLRYALRSEPSPLSPWSAETALVLLAQGLVFWRVGLYRGIWRFASVPDLINILKACLAGLVAIFVGLFLYNRMDQVSRTVLLLYPFVLTALLGMPRLLYRVWKDHQRSKAEQGGLRVLILGAGQAGEALVRDLRRTGAYQHWARRSGSHGRVSAGYLAASLVAVAFMFVARAYSFVVIMGVVGLSCVVACLAWWWLQGGRRRQG